MPASTKMHLHLHLHLHQQRRTLQHATGTTMTSACRTVAVGMPPTRVVDLPSIATPGARTCSDVALHLAIETDFAPWSSVSLRLTAKDRVQATTQHQLLPQQ